MSSCISILGSTGSIGRQTLEVARELGLSVAAPDVVPRFPLPALFFAASKSICSHWLRRPPVADSSQRLWSSKENAARISSMV